MMTKLVLAFVNLTLVMKTGYTEIRWKSVDLGVSSNSFQRCLDPIRTCQCDRLCAFYRDCCKDYKSDEQTIILYNQNNRSLNFDDFECRLMPGYDKIDPSQISNCIERSSYWMISKCPRTAPKTLKTQCEEKHALDELVEVKYINPVNDPFGNMYKNYYCALCHNIPSDEVMVWSMEEVCHDCPEELPLSQDHFINLTSQDCYLLSEKPIRMIETRKFSDIRLRGCHEDMVRSCPLGSRPYDSEMCSQISSPGYFRGHYYKNIFCARCHGLTNAQYWSDESFLQCYEMVAINVGVGGVMQFLDPLCSLIRCSRPVSLCSRTDKTSLQYLSLTANDTFKCSHLKERGERCFFQESRLKNSTLFWKKMGDSNALWGNDQNQRHSATIFQLPKNVSDKWRIQLDEDLVDNVQRLSAEKKSCYLEYIEVVEVCSDQEWIKLGECNGEIVEVPGDEVLDNENDFLYELTQNVSKTMSPSWYTVHTRFPFMPRSFPVTKTLVCLTYPENQDVTVWYRIFCGFCIGVAVVCHLATFVTYATFRPLRNTFGISLMCFVMSLAIALSLLEFVADYATGVIYLCKTVAIVSHFFWISSFCWVTILAWDLHVTLSPSKMRVRQAFKSKRLAAYCCCGWGLPCVIVAVCIAMWLIDIPEIPVMYGSAQGKSCWLYDDLIQLLAVAAPLVVCISVNVCLFLMISRSLYIYKKDSRVTQNDLPNPKRRIIELLVYVKVSLLMGFAWIFGFLADFTKVKALWWLFYLSFLIQACLIFVFFGLSGKVRNMWKESRVFTSSTRTTNG